MSDFAKLFTHPDVGQVLVMRDYDNDNDECPYRLSFRFEYQDAFVEPFMRYREEAALDRAFDAISEAHAQRMVYSTLAMLRGEE